MRRMALVLTVVAAVVGAALLTGGWHRPAAKVSAHVILSARTVTAGTPLTARVIVDNRSSHALHVRGCGTPVWVTLANGHYHPDQMAPSCAGTRTVPAGQTTYRVTVVTTYLGCDVGQADRDLPRCDPGDRLPPLPAGTYQASLNVDDGFAAAPPSIPVHVTRVTRP